MFNRNIYFFIAAVNKLRANVLFIMGSSFLVDLKPGISEAMIRVEIFAISSLSYL